MDPTLRKLRLLDRTSSDPSISPSSAAAAAAQELQAVINDPGNANSWVAWPFASSSYEGDGPPPSLPLDQYPNVWQCRGWHWRAMMQAVMLSLSTISSLRSNITELLLHPQITIRDFEVYLRSLETGYAPRRESHAASSPQPLSLGG